MEKLGSPFLLTRRAALAALAAGALAATLGGCQVGGSSSPTASSKTKVSVALDWYPWSNHVGLLLARDDGHFAAEGLDVNLYVPANPEDGLKLVGAGKDHFGISYQTDVLLAREAGLPVKSVAALVQHPLNTIMTLRDSGITRPRQLEGKKLGMPGLPSDEALYRTMVERDGGDPAKVETVDVGFDLVPTLIGRRVDAVIGGYWVHESILAEEKGFPVNVLRVEDWGVPDYYELVVVAGDNLVRDNPDLIRRFLRAMAKGYESAIKDHARALEALFKESPEADRPMETEGIGLLAPLWLDDSGRFGSQTAERWAAYAEWMRERGVLGAQARAADAFTAELIP